MSKWEYKLGVVLQSYCLSQTWVLQDKMRVIFIADIVVTFTAISSSSSNSFRPEALLLYHVHEKDYDWQLSAKLINLGLLCLVQ